MNLLKLLSLVLVSHAAITTPQAQIVTSANMQILEAHQESIDNHIPIENGALNVDLSDADTQPSRFSSTTLIKRLWGTVAPTMEAVIACESHGRQFIDGKVLISPTGDYGLTQINEKVWDSTAKELNLDYKGSERDNIYMAKVVYDAQGFSGWTCYNRYIKK